ncbi:hypothetical protein LUZ63_001920 [Rhynchospora breviuscula]|uniref:Short-chain dehydrogenase/reductase n=1 Tax=Rhynchospora breviuscula TaxID=2022672 RepID=A0A9Q0CXX4_9POAL|nr:hypothetical protein LUZ63_001920 [Rhynchospora breviuscula]
MEYRQNRIAIVTGANKGIGLEISRQLSENGILVVLTARDEVRGQAAVKKLQDVGVKDVVFHQLDISDPASITFLKEFVKTKFGKLDILVNNAGVGGVELQSPTTLMEGDPESLYDAINETYEISKECIDINYYGTKAMCEAFIPLLHQSKSPRIVNVSSTFGKLQFISGDSIRKELRNIDNLTEDRLEKLLGTFLIDCKEGRLKESGWPERTFSAYKVSKNAVSAYTRILAKNHPRFIVNCVCPGYVKTDFNYNTGTISVEEGAKGPVMLALLPDGSPSGQFYNQTEPTSFE